MFLWCLWVPESSQEWKDALTAMLSRVPLLWLSHRFHCGFIASEHIEATKTDLFFFFLFSPFLPSNFLRDIKNCVGIQFFSNDSGQDISNTHKFCLSSRIFLGYILFLPWYINDSTVTTRCWISQQKITDEQLYIQKQQTLYNIDANVWVIFEYIAHLKNCFFSGPCQRT